MVVYGSPLLMICLPLLFFGLWAWWARAVGTARLAKATAVIVCAFLLHAWIVKPASGLDSTWFVVGWQLAGHGLLWIGVTLPMLGRVRNAPPPLPKAASFRTPALRLARSAFVWPWFVWAAFVAVVHTLAAGNWGAYVGPMAGAVGLGYLQPLLRMPVLALVEPTPLAQGYAALRVRDTRVMYGLTVALSFLATAAALVPHLGLLAYLWALLLVVVLYTWADAQSYLQRRHAAGMSISHSEPSPA